MKRTITTFLALLIFASIGFGQNMVVDPFGVSPARVARDTVGNPMYVGIFDREFSGSTNVGVESKVYVRATFVDSFLTAPVWTIIDKPDGSSALIFNEFDKFPDENADDIAYFFADLEGTYTVVATEGTYADTIVFDAGTYSGVGDPATSFTCAQCHSTTYDQWVQTGHSDMLERGLDGTWNAYGYGEHCIKCHTTGYDADADNAGFDDHGFVYPDTTYVGMADSMYIEFPDAMARANIQCESCHGPGGGHNDGTKTEVFELAVDQCAKCHDDDSHHYFPSQWYISGHASGNHLYNSSYAGGSCVPCHNGRGFINAVDEVSESLTEKVAITCAVCHDPHDVTNMHQLRTVEATLKNGEEVVGGGLGELCMNCHMSRRDGEAYVLEETEGGRHYGPHYGPQADMLIGTNVPTWGYEMPSSPHMNATENACVDCHMYEGEEHGFEVTYGSHSFSMVDTAGNDNVAACSGCHGNVGESFADKKFYINGNADHDGNGVEEGLQHEVQGLLDTLAALLPQDDEGNVSIDDTVEIAYDIRAAGYIYLFVEEDRSLGVHNPQYAIALVQTSIKVLRGELVDIADEGDLRPVNYQLSQNYPNPFNPTTTIKYSIKEAGKVELKVFDMLGREVVSLVNSTMTPGSYEVVLDAANFASGVYFYRIIAGNGKFIQVRKMILMK